MDLPIHIIEKYLRGEANEQETRLVNDWFYSFDEEQDMPDEALVALRRQIGDRIHSRLDKSIALSIRQEQKAKRIRILRVAAAAAVILGIGIYGWVQRNNADKPLLAAKTVTKPVAVGNNRATLILADGKKLSWIVPLMAPLITRMGWK